MGRAARPRDASAERIFLSTPFDLGSAELLVGLGVPALKVSSGELTNTPFLRELAALGVPLLVSTGMGSAAEVADAVEACAAAPGTVLFHCVSAYPAPLEQCNLRAIPEMVRAHGLPVGWSDHTTGVTSALGAVALGCVGAREARDDRPHAGPVPTTRRPSSPRRSRRTSPSAAPSPGALGTARSGGCRRRRRTPTSCGAAGTRRATSRAGTVLGRERPRAAPPRGRRGPGGGARRADRADRGRGGRPGAPRRPRGRRVSDRTSVAAFVGHAGRPRPARPGAHRARRRARPRPHRAHRRRVDRALAQGGAPGARGVDGGSWHWPTP